jgi:threonine/homoserine/homoserine lactone efflux protein
MKLNAKKSLWASAIALLLGSSCCWLTTVAAWFGAATVVGFFVKFMGNFQGILLGIGVFLGGLGVFLYFFRKK